MSAENSVYCAEEIVADAMMCSVYSRVTSMITQPIVTPDWILTNAWTPDALAEWVTTGECGTISVQVLERLFPQYGSQFSELFLLSSHKDQSAPFRVPDWRYHTYFVAIDTSGVFYAGSPANYGRRNDTSGNYLPHDHLSHLVTAKSYPQLLQEIVSIDGGIWPTQDVVESAIQSKALTPYEIGYDGNIKFVGINNTKSPIYTVETDETTFNWSL